MELLATRSVTRLGEERGESRFSLGGPRGGRMGKSLTSGLADLHGACH